MPESASMSPSISPSESPSVSPSMSPSISPSVSPSLSPSASVSPSASPSVSPSKSPSVSPSASPSVSPSRSPSVSPSASPSVSPSVSPSPSPSVEPYTIIVPVATSMWRGIYLVKWTGFQVAGDTGTPFACPNYPDKSIQVVGTFGGATVTIQGSNMIDNPTYATLNDGTGAALTITSAGIKQILENTYWVRPIISGGDANTNLDVYLLVETMK